MPCDDGNVPVATLAMPGARPRQPVRHHGIREHRAALKDLAKAVGPLMAVRLHVVSAKLIDDNEHDQRRSRRLTAHGWCESGVEEHHGGHGRQDEARMKSRHRRQTQKHRPAR